MSAPSRIPAVLAVAGSDSGGGAGIQADLKAFAACGVHGMTAITAITAQNTVEVAAVEHVAPAMILAQVRAVARDIGVDAVKVGMLGTAAAAEAVAVALAELPGVPVVVDPVMVSESGAVLLERDARAALIGRVLPLATVVTPNVPEARALTGLDEAGPAELAAAVRSLGPEIVVVTGGHADATDRYFDGRDLVEIPGPRHPDGAAHGSGCTHASALCAQLALGQPPLAAARRAREVAGAAVRDGLRGLGRGPGPVDVLRVGARVRTPAGAPVV